MQNKNIWAIIPAHNEEKNIVDVIKEVKKYTKNIIVIDDGSEDNTYETAKKEKITVLKHIVNLGKGAALKTGCDFAYKKGAEILIFIDSDGQHEPKEIPNFITALKGSEIVFGYRKPNRKMPAILKFGNDFINKTTRLLYNISLKDTQCGYRAFKRSIYRKIRWKSQDYSVESEIVTRVGKQKIRHAEIPIQTIYSDKYKGTTFLDGIKIVIDLLLWRFVRK